MSQAQEVFLFNPTSVSGCQLWLDAADSTTISLSGSSVTQWNDKSGNARNFLQATSGNRPTFGTYLSYPSILFTGANSQSLSNNYIQTGTGGRHTYLVFTDISTTANIYGNPVMFYMAEGNSTQGGDWRAAFDGANQYLSIDVLQGAKTMRTSPNVTSMRTQRTLALWGMPTGAKVSNTYVYGNGTQFTTQVVAFGADPNINTLNSPPTRIGGGQTGYATFALYELLHYNVELTTSQRQQIEGYLAWKWGLQGNLPTDHPFKTYRPLAQTPIPTSVPPMPIVTQNVAVFVPPQISGCRLWLDAADTSSLVLSGTNVTQWTNKTGNGNMTQTNVANQPILSSNNGVQMVRFNNAWLSNLSFPFNWLNSSLFIVFQQVSVAAGLIPRVFSGVPNPTSQDDYSSTNGMHFAGGQTTNSPPSLFYAANYNANIGQFIIPTIPGTPPSPFGIYQFLMNNNTGSLYLNGFFNTSDNRFLLNNTSGTGLGLGHGWTAGGFNTTGNAAPINGWVAEVVLYNTALTTAQRQQVEGYLAWKWGLVGSLPVGHPYKTAPIAPFPFRSIAFNGTLGQWIPTQISGTQLWLDAADVSSFTLSGSSVTQWRDKSGNGYIATGTVAPTYNSNTRFVIFNGSSQYFTVSNGAYPSGNTPYSIFLVAFTNNAANPQWIFYGGNQLTNQAIGGIFFTTNAVWHSWWINEYRVDNSITNTVPAILNLSYNTTRSIVINGGTPSINSPGATRNNPSGPNYIGQRLAAEYLNGGIGEFIIYTSEIPISQRQQVEGYLAWKWGLVGSLPSSHPYKKFPPSP